MGDVSAARPGVLLDVDGTLLDTNHLHALAWWRAFRRLDRTYPMHDIHRLIGMGGDKLVPEIAGEDVDGAADAYAEEFDRLQGDVSLLPGARELVAALHDAGLAVVLATSAEPDVLDRFLDVLDIEPWLAGTTSSGDAEASKPDAEIFEVAIDRYDLDPQLTVVIGDTIWDAKAAQRAGVGFVAVATGGTAAEDLRRAGAARTYDDAEDLVADLHRGPLAPLIAAT